MKLQIRVKLHEPVRVNVLSLIKYMINYPFLPYQNGYGQHMCCPYGAINAAHVQVEFTAPMMMFYW